MAARRRGRGGPYTSAVAVAEPKPEEPRAAPGPWSSLGLGAVGAVLGLLPAILGSRDSFVLLAWIAMTGPAIGAAIGARGVDPWRFGAVAPGLWGLGLAAIAAADDSAQLPSPLLAMAAWIGLYFAGFGFGRAWGDALTSALASLALCALLVALPTRAGLPGRPWAARAAVLCLDLSPFVVLGECGGVRDMAWHRSIYAAGGTDRFQRAPHAPAGTALCLLAIGLIAAEAARRARPFAGPTK